MKIHICKNFSKINKLQQKLTDTFSNDTVVIKKCLSMCHICQDQPLAKIKTKNGKSKKIKAKTIHKLIAKIKDKTQ